MKTYPIRDVTNDKYLNPAPPATRPVGNIQKIIIHHDAVTRPHNYDTMARLRTEAAVHYKNLGPGLQYHYSIDNTGSPFSTNTFLYSQNPNAQYNSFRIVSLGIRILDIVTGKQIGRAHV